MGESQQTQSKFKNWQKSLLGRNIEKWVKIANRLALVLRAYLTDRTHSFAHNFIKLMSWCSKMNGIKRSNTLRVPTRNSPKPWFFDKIGLDNGMYDTWRIQINSSHVSYGSTTSTENIGIIAKIHRALGTLDKISFWGVFLKLSEGAANAAEERAKHHSRSV